jgi:alpha-N-acetylglucosaminidase
MPAGPVWSVALSYLLSAAPMLKSASSYRFDLVDVCREALSDLFDQKLAVFQKAFQAGNKAAVASAGEELMPLIDDYDRLLSTDTNFMLGPWIDWARQWGATDVEKDWLEFNARNQITMWGPSGQINDYAKKDWGGLVRGYYKKRWNVCIEQAKTDAPTWDRHAYSRNVMPVQMNFSQAPFADHYPVQPEGDAVDVASELFDKYFGESSLLI